MKNQVLTERERVLHALQQWINQRPGLDPRNYISGWNDKAGRAAYRAESRHITQQLHDAQAMLAAVSWRTSIDAETLKAAFNGAFSGRLSWDGSQLDYTTGQYWPTEYRAAACAVLARCLWEYWRDNYNEARGTYDGARDAIMREARRELGRSIANRWFN